MSKDKVTPGLTLKLPAIGGAEQDFIICTSMWVEKKGGGWRRISELEMLSKAKSEVPLFYEVTASTTTEEK